MKILFSADWHIKLGQRNVPKDWQVNRYKLLFEKLENITCDIHIVGGDIFDRKPTLEELELFFEFVIGTKHKTLIYDGNHEATKKGSTFLSYLDHVTFQANPLVRIIDNYYEQDNFEIYPYCELDNLKTAKAKKTILFTHVRGEIAPHVKPELDLDILDQWDIVVAGDLHSYSNCQRNILYPGSPVTTSFHRSKSKAGVILFDTVTKEHEWIELDLPQLLRKTVSSEDEIVSTDYHHTIYEVEGNVADLAKVKSNELIDKKVVNKTVDSKLSFSEEMTIQDELSMYLKEQVNLTTDQIKEVNKVFNDYYSQNGMG